jgi:glycosyltransferase involved in cell wall biosynthesis
MARTKKIYYHQHAASIHSLYRILFDNPPKGYEFIVRQRTAGIEAANHNRVLWWVNLHIIKKLVSTVAIKDFLFRFKRIPKNDLIYSGGYAVEREQPWVADFEYVSSFTGYDNAQLRRKRKHFLALFESPYCKALIPINDWSKETFLSVFDTPAIRKKVHVVRVAIPPPKPIKRVPHKKVTLLFIGSANLPKDFYHKGGKAIFKVYDELKKKYDIKLIVRCAIPPELEGWIAPYRKDKDVEIIEQRLTGKELDGLFARSDILVAPAVITPALAFLDAFARELPVVTTDVWANREVVTHQKTGIIVPGPRIPVYEYAKVPYGIWDLDKELRRFDEDRSFIKKFASGVEVLLKQPALIREYGARGREEVVSGRLSLQERNKRLKRVLDAATAQKKRRGR